MSFKIEFATDNAAFEEDASQETAHILREIADKIMEGQINGSIRDTNGNRIGSYNLVHPAAGPIVTGPDMCKLLGTHVCGYDEECPVARDEREADEH